MWEKLRRVSCMKITTKHIFLHLWFMNRHFLNKTSYHINQGKNIMKRYYLIRGNDRLWLIHFLLLWWHPASVSRTSLLDLIFLVCLHFCLKSCTVCTDLLIALFNSSILSYTYWSLNKQYNWGRGTLWFTLVFEVNATHNRPQHTPHVTNYILWRICKHIASNSDKIFKLLPNCFLPHYYSLTYSHCPPLLFTNNLFFFRYPLHGSSHIIPQNPHNSHLPRTPHLIPHTYLQNHSLRI